MSSGRTVWWAKDSAWWRRERIVELGEEFGAAGPAVIDWLSCEAKLQNDGGLVKAGVRSCGRGCFVDAVTVGHVLSRAVALGLLDDFQKSDGRFTCRISGWRSDQERAGATARKAAQRERDRSANADSHADHEPRGSVTDRDTSRAVTAGHGRHVRSLNRTEQERTTEPPLPPKGGRDRDRIAYEGRLRSYALSLLPEVPTETSIDAVRSAIASATTRSDQPTTEQVRAAIKRWHPELVDALEAPAAAEEAVA